MGLHLDIGHWRFHWCCISGVTGAHAMHPCVMIMNDVRRQRRWRLPNSALCATGRKLACCIDLQLVLELGASSTAGLQTPSSRLKPAHPRAPQAPPSGPAAAGSLLRLRAALSTPRPGAA